jgi:hypothetical protein
VTTQKQQFNVSHTTSEVGLLQRDLLSKIILRLLITVYVKTFSSFKLSSIHVTQQVLLCQVKLGLGANDQVDVLFQNFRKDEN